MVVLYFAGSFFAKYFCSRPRLPSSIFKPLVVGVVLSVRLQVRGQVFDALGEQGDLYGGRAGIFWGRFELGDVVQGRARVWSLATILTTRDWRPEEDEARTVVCETEETNGGW